MYKFKNVFIYQKILNFIMICVHSWMYRTSHVGQRYLGFKSPLVWIFSAFSDLHVAEMSFIASQLHVLSGIVFMIVYTSNGLAIIPVQTCICTQISLIAIDNDLFISSHIRSLLLNKVDTVMVNKNLLAYFLIEGFSVFILHNSMYIYCKVINYFESHIVVICIN